jgi:choloylglycine hydrolase
VAVADMAVHGVRTPYDPGKPSVIHSLAMRLILDYAKNTEEAIDLLHEYNIHFVGETCHLMIADASGKSVVVEFIGGELKPTFTGEHWQVCTNHELCGKKEAENDARCQRYRTASDQLAGVGSSASAGDVMKIMESVKQPYTMWSSVYDLSSRELEFAYRQHFDNVYRDRIE